MAYAEASDMKDEEPRNPNYWGEKGDPRMEPKTATSGYMTVGPARPVEMMSDEEVLDVLFTYHKPEPDQIPRYNEIREAGKHLARAILRDTPKCADQTAAIRKVREAVMTASAAIAMRGRV